MILCRYIRHYSAYVKRPAVTCFSAKGHVMSGSNVTNACIRKPAWWILLGHWQGCHHWSCLGYTFSLQRNKQCLGGMASMQMLNHVLLFWQTSGTVPWSIDDYPTEVWPRSAVMYCTLFLNVYTVLNSVGDPSISKKGPVVWRGLSSYR